MARCTSASEPVTTHDVAAPTILDQLEAAEKAATVGPWEVIPESDDGYVIGQYNERWPQPLQDPEGRFAEDDAELVILLRNHAADLIAVARAAQEYKQAHDGYRVGLHDQPRLIEDALGCLAKALAPLTEGDTK